MAGNVLRQTNAKSDTPRIGILVVAYNAAGTLAQTLDRIPEDFRGRIEKIFVCDDHSQDSTYLVGLGYKQMNTQLPLVVTRHPRNLGYGGNQKAGYQMAIDNGLDIIVLLHGDGQYAPELLPEIVAPLERGEADAVFGSRMMHKGQARQGGMPLYKYVGNKILTRYENMMLGSDLSEFHSGYRAYSVESLKQLPFQQNSDVFDFDTEIIIQLHAAGMRIKEIPIPTYYGDEICYVNGMQYALDVVKDVTKYRLAKLGIGEATVHTTEKYELKPDPGTSHSTLIQWASEARPCKTLDVGCAGGYLAEQLARFGHKVTGIDIVESQGVRGRLDSFIQADLDQGIPTEVDSDYDLIVLGDVIEHLRDPDSFMTSITSHLSDEGVILASIPNFGHWYPRARTLGGAFDYDQHGILDKGHVRFFTKKSFERLLTRSGLRAVRHDHVGVPISKVGGGILAKAFSVFEKVGLKLWPRLFAYQFTYALEPANRPIETYEANPAKR